MPEIRNPIAPNKPIKKQSDNDLDIMQRNIYDLELALKGMIKKDFWLELESMICRLDVN